MFFFFIYMCFVSRCWVVNQERNKFLSITFFCNIKQKGLFKTSNAQVFLEKYHSQVHIIILGDLRIQARDWFQGPKVPITVKNLLVLLLLLLDLQSKTFSCHQLGKSLADSSLGSKNTSKNKYSQHKTFFQEKGSSSSQQNNMLQRSLYWEGPVPSEISQNEQRPFFWFLV